MLSEIKSLAEKLAPRLIEIRRHIHTHPELSGEEYQTAAYIAGVLSSYGIPVKESVGKTGVVGNLASETSAAKTLAIRVDMVLRVQTEARRRLRCSSVLRVRKRGRQGRRGDLGVWA